MAKILPRMTVMSAEVLLEWASTAATRGNATLTAETVRDVPALDLKPIRLVPFVQNHTQITNFGCGLCCHLLTSPGRYKALTTEVQGV
jgi:hypothetical protein